MNEGYKQASEISRNLILVFVCGIIIGTFIGWGARMSWSPDVPPSDPALALNASPAENPEPPSPTSEPDAPPATPPAPATTPEPQITPVAEEQPETEHSPFDADVDGLWPAAHFFTGIQGTKADVDTLEWLNEFKPGGVVLGPENIIDPLQLAALVLQIKQAVGLGTKITDPPFIIYEDGEHALPRLLATAGDGSESGRLPDAAAAQAKEGLKQGVGVFLGPSLDFFTPGVSEARLEMTTLGSSAETVSGPGLAYIHQLTAAGLVSVAREFPGAGLAMKSESGIWQIPADQMDALAAAMEPFKAAMDAGIPGILVGHMAVPGIDTERPNRPAALSPKLLKLLVRQQWNYDGVLVAADITRHPMTRDLPRDEIALKALYSGCDAVVLKDVNRAGLRTICDSFVRYAAHGDFPSEQFEASRQRLRDWLGRLGTPMVTPAQLPETVVAEALPDSTPAPVAEPAPTPDTAPAPAPISTDAPVPPTSEAPQVADAPGTTPTTEPTVAEAPVETPVEAPAATEAPATPPPATEAAPEPATSPVVEAPIVAPAPEPAPVPAEAPTKPAEHTIVKGDSLNALAKRYSVAVGDLRAWNKMESDVVKIGQVIKIQAPAPEIAPEAASAEATADKEAAPLTVPVAPAAPEASPATTTPPAAETPVETAVESGAPSDASPAATPAETPPAEAAPEQTAPPTEIAPVESVTVAQPTDTDKREHTVASGETLGSIAGMYGVTVAEIQAWNALDPGETVINAGASLVLYLPVATPDGATPEPAAKSAEPEKVVAPEPEPGTYEVYEVAAGDNLRRIAQRFGTTQQKLIEMNNLKSADLVQIGWKLKVPKQATAPISGSTP